MPLKVRKQKWMGRPRKDKTMRGQALNPSMASQIRYYDALRALIRDMSNQTTESLDKFFKEPDVVTYFAQDASVADHARMLMNELSARFQQIFNLASKPLATRVTAEADKNSVQSLEGSLKQLSGGLTIDADFMNPELKDIFTATIAENVSLIKSISSDYFTQVQGAVMRSITTGNGLQDLVPFLQNYEGVSLRRARTIARDQTRKAFSNMNFSRMKSVGVQEYEWLHSAGGQKPRRLHQDMSGNIYRIDTPPIIDEKTSQRGKPGDLINCRCRAIPIIRFDEMQPGE